MDTHGRLSYTQLPSPAAQTHRFSVSGPRHDPNSLSRLPTNKIPLSLRLRIVGPTIITMVCLSVAIEFALYFSNKDHGYPLRHFGVESVQWIGNFLPTLLVCPFVWMWESVDRELRRLQPYLIMSRRPVRAKESVLLNPARERSFQFSRSSPGTGKYLFMGTFMIVAMNIFLQPFAASLFFVQKGTDTTDIPIRGDESLGLNPAFKDISSFVVASAYAEAAPFYNLSDPPFVIGGWTTGKFEIPTRIPLDSNLSVRTTALYTNVSCVRAGVSMQNSNATTWTLTASIPGSGPGCTVAQTIDGSVPGLHYGVDALSGCSFRSSIDGISSRQNPFDDPNGLRLRWFAAIPRIGRTSSDTTNATAILRGRDVSSSRGSAVVCGTALAAHSVEAIVNGATGLLNEVKILGDAPDNNVTKGDFAGKAFDGLFFNSSDGFDLDDPSAKDMISAIQTGLSAAIFKAATDLNPAASMDSVFENGFLEPTKKIYTQYLSTVARSVYFVPADLSLEGELRTSELRLWVSPVSAHILSALLVIVAFAGAAIQFIHRRERRHLYLASYPGSMAHSMGLLSHPRLTSFSAQEESRRDAAQGLVGPLDDEKTMEKKLEGVWFTLDRTTGFVLPVIPGENWALRGGSLGPYTGRHSRGPSEMEYELEDPRKGLLSPEHHAED